MTRRQRLTLLTAILGSAVVTIDSSVINVALPAIAHDLGGGLSTQQWVSNAYLLTLGSLILVLIHIAVPASPRKEGRRVDFVGAALCALGLAGVVFALIEEPRHGWGSPVISITLVGGIAAFAGFLAFERRTPEPMLKLDLFARRNFAVGNLETLCVYAGLSILFFFLTIYLQEVAGYSALKSGLTTLPVTIVMFALSKRFGALADRLGPRLFMGAGPLIAAARILLLARVDRHVNYWTDLFPGLLIFALGLTLTVSPLTAAVLADADESDAGIASAINNAVARVAGLIGVSVIGVVVAGSLTCGAVAPEPAPGRAVPPRTLGRRRPRA